MQAMAQSMEYVVFFTLGSWKGIIAVGSPYRAPADSGRCCDRSCRIERVRICPQQSGCQVHCKRALRYLHLHRVSMWHHLV